MITPRIDHVIINVRDRLDEGVALYQRLGFRLTPRGHHTLGSSNNLAVLGEDYIELLGVEPGGGARADVLDWPAGLNGIAFRTTDAAETHAALADAGAPVLPVQSFSRPVDLGMDLGGATADAAFRTVRIPREAFPPGRVFFCEHETPDLVWRPEWQAHPNGAAGILGVVVAATHPADVAGLLGTLFGPVAREPDGYRLQAGPAVIEVVTPDVLAARFGSAAPDAAGRDGYMAALVLRTAFLAQAAAALQAGRVPAMQRAGGLVVPAAQAGGLTLVFRG